MPFDFAEKGKCCLKKSSPRDTPGPFGFVLDDAIGACMIEVPVMLAQETGPDLQLLFIAGSLLMNQSPAGICPLPTWALVEPAQVGLAKMQACARETFAVRTEWYTKEAAKLKMANEQCNVLADDMLKACDHFHVPADAWLDIATDVGAAVARTFNAKVELGVHTLTAECRALVRLLVPTTAQRDGRVLTKYFVSAEKLTAFLKTLHEKVNDDPYAYLRELKCNHSTTPAPDAVAIFGRNMARFPMMRENVAENASGTPSPCE